MVRLARVSAFSMCHPQLIRSHQLTRHNGGNTLKSQGNRKGRRAPPLNWVECGCDWLGDKRHLSRDQRTTVDANPAHYCMPAASMSGHLCLVPGITRGARKILQSHAVSTTAALAGAAGHPALQQHTM